MKLPEVLTVEVGSAGPRTLHEVIERFRGMVVNPFNMRALRADLLRVLEGMKCQGDLDEVPALWVVHHPQRQPGVATVCDEEGIRALAREEGLDADVIVVSSLLEPLRQKGWEIV